jgi:hypothetical protein
MGRKKTPPDPATPAPVTPKTGRIDPAPPDLIAAIAEQRSVVYVGAGMSIGAGYPGWPALLEHLIGIAVRLRDVTVEHAKELQALVSKNDGNTFLMVAQELSDRMGRERLLDEIADLYSDDGKAPTANHTLITQISFDLAITTNYDRLLERSYAQPGHLPSVYTHSQAPNFVDALWKKKFFILKAHGDIAHKQDMVLTERDYRDIVFRSIGYQSALSAIFTTKSVLFLGVSLTDPETRLLLAYLHDAFHGSGARHYALVSSTEFTTTVASRWRKDFKVELITYEPTPGRPEVGAFLKSLIPPNPLDLVPL